MSDPMTTPTPRDCEHGQLARSCDICALKRELAASQLEIAKLKAHAEAMWKWLDAQDFLPVELGEIIRAYRRDFPRKR